MSNSTSRRSRVTATCIASTAFVWSCASVTTEDAARWGCVAGTFLNVAATNFGAHYVHDAATLVNLFAGTDLKLAANNNDSGCSIFNVPDNVFGLGEASSEGEEEEPGGSAEESGESFEAEAGDFAEYDQSGFDSSAETESFGFDQGFEQEMGSDWPESPEMYEGYGEMDSAEEPESFQEFGSESSMNEAPEPRLEVALLRAVDFGGEMSLEPIQDGATLRRAEGDRFQIFFSVPRESYVYAYAVDATAWMQRLFPDPERGHANPVLPWNEVLLPREGYFFGLDEHPGNQEIWILVSDTPRPEIEQLLADYPLGRERPETQLRSRSGKPVYDRVTRSTILRRGLVEIGPGQPTQVGVSEGSDSTVTPDRLFTATAGDDLAISRWFVSE